MTDKRPPARLAAALRRLPLRLVTNQWVFSPTDTMPLTPRVKLLMGVQGVAALVTTGVIVAQAVNLLG